MISESVVEKVGEGVRSARRSLTQPWKMGELRGRWGRRREWGCRSDVVGDEAEKQQVAAACWSGFDADSLHNKYRVPKETLITPKRKKNSKECI